MTSRIDWTGFAFPKQSPSSKKPSRQSGEALKGQLFRRAVWVRDQALDRATGRPVSLEHRHPDRRGEVHHLCGRRVRPDWKYDPAHAILLSATHHRLADARGGRLLQIDGDDATKPITFTLRDRKGRIVWKHTR